MRTEGHQRRYDAQAMYRVEFIHHARDLGFDVDEVRSLLSLADLPNASCKAVDALARHQVERIDSKIRRLRAAARTNGGHTRLPRPRVRACRILHAQSEPRRHVRQAKAK